MKVPITGKCFCGRIRLETNAEPLWVAHCHCNSCRRSTGAPVTTFVCFGKSKVRMSGEAEVYNSSPGVFRSFCGDCGTPLCYESDHCPGEIHFYISVMDTPGAFVPQKHAFHDEHIPWLELHDDLPRYSGLDRSAPSSWGPLRRTKK